MADILKITTPLVNKNQIQPNKQATDPSVPFNLQDVTKVIKPASNGELLKQNNGMIQKEEASTILSNLLKDPSVTVNFLKNIFILQEIIKLLPVNNSTVTQEIEQLFNSLLIKPEDIVVEMMRQENTSTVFKGELFNFLRGLIARNPTPEIRAGVANLLKSINGLLGKQVFSTRFLTAFSFSPKIWRRANYCPGGCRHCPTSFARRMPLKSSAS